MSHSIDPEGSEITGGGGEQRSHRCGGAFGAGEPGGSRCGGVSYRPAGQVRGTGRISGKSQMARIRRGVVARSAKAWATVRSSSVRSTASVKNRSSAPTTWPRRRIGTAVTARNPAESADVSVAHNTSLGDERVEDEHRCQDGEPRSRAPNRAPFSRGASSPRDEKLPMPLGIQVLARSR